MLCCAAGPRDAPTCENPSWLQPTQPVRPSRPVHRINARDRWYLGGKSSRGPAVRKRFASPSSASSCRLGTAGTAMPQIDQDGGGVGCSQAFPQKVGRFNGFQSRCCARAQSPRLSLAASSARETLPSNWNLGLRACLTGWHMGGNSQLLLLPLACTNRRSAMVWNLSLLCTVPSRMRSRQPQLGSHHRASRHAPPRDLTPTVDPVLAHLAILSLPGRR